MITLREVVCWYMGVPELTQSDGDEQSMHILAAAYILAEAAAAAASNLCSFWRLLAPG